MMIPVDVKIDIENKISKYKLQERKLLREARNRTTEAETLEIVRHELERMLEEWERNFGFKVPGKIVPEGMKRD